MTADTIAFMFVLAQIAGIFIGFGALISASKSAAATKQEAESLALIVYIGIMIVVGALLPVLLNQYGLEKDLTLRFGAIAFLILAWLLILRTLPAAVESIKKTPAFAAFFWAQEVAIQLPLFLVLFGVWSHQAESLYLTALVISAFEAAQLLVGLVFANAEKTTE